MVIRDYKYTPEDVDCRYCKEYAHGRCRATKCPYLKERIEAGVLTYREAVNESFEKRSPLRRRINVVLSRYDKSFWRNEEHFRRFQEAETILGFYISRNTSEYYAALFLLTAEKELFQRLLDCFTETGIDFSRANLRDISAECYTLYKIAKSIYTDSGEVSVDELADPDLVSTELFHLVINAMLIYRYGLSATLLKRKDGGHGAV